MSSNPTPVAPDDEDAIWLGGWDELEDGDVVELSSPYAADPAGDKVVGAITRFWVDPDGKTYEKSDRELVLEIELDEHPGRTFRVAGTGGPGPDEAWELVRCWRPVTN